MSVADPGPAGTNDPTGPIRLPKWWQAAVIAATSGALALPGYVLWQSVTTCGGGLECLLNLPVAGAFSVVVMPVTAWLVWKGAGSRAPSCWPWPRWRWSGEGFCPTGFGWGLSR
ncbi:MAG: hypothetical protein ABI903_12205 [Actinomycetota bacterium]